MAIRKTQIRGFFAAIFAILLIVFLAAFGAIAVGMEIPGLVLITDAFGVYVDSGE